MPPKVVPGARRAVVAEKPGEDETLTGQPLTGGSGRLMEMAYRKAGVDWNGLTRANIVNCRDSASGNVFPTDPEGRAFISKPDAEASVEHCLDHHLLPVLRGQKLGRIDIVGDKALEYLGGKSEGILKWRGSPISVLGASVPNCVPTVHPSFIMRGKQAFLPVQINDLKKSLVVPPENYNLFPSLEDVQAFDAKVFALDIETTYPRVPQEITLVGLSAERFKAMVVPFRGAYKQELKRIILNATDIITQNGIQFDCPMLFEALDIKWEPN